MSLLAHQALHTHVPDWKKDSEKDCCDKLLWDHRVHSCLEPLRPGTEDKKKRDNWFKDITKGKVRMYTSIRAMDSKTPCKNSTSLSGLGDNLHKESRCTIKNISWWLSGLGDNLQKENSRSLKRISWWRRYDQIALAVIKFRWVSSFTYLGSLLGSASGKRSPTLGRG